MAINGVEGRSPAQLLDEVERGGRFVVYDYAFSVIVASFKRSSDIYYIPPGASRVSPGWGYTAIALLAGPWGFPWGIVFTIAALVTNLGGGRDVTPDILPQLGFARLAPLPPPDPLQPYGAPGRQVPMPVQPYVAAPAPAPQYGQAYPQPPAPEPEPAPVRPVNYIQQQAPQSRTDATSAVVPSPKMAVLGVLAMAASLDTATSREALARARTVAAKLLGPAAQARIQRQLAQPVRVMDAKTELVQHTMILSEQGDAMKADVLRGAEFVVKGPAGVVGPGEQFLATLKQQLGI